MATLFYLSLFLCGYSYFIYPLILKLIPQRPASPVPALEDYVLPALSLIITAYNEEDRIREKLENTLELDYPRDRLEVIVASDFSTDATDSIAGSYASRGIRHS